MKSSAAPINRLRILRWRQFGKLDIEFHDRYTVFVGRNGSGKSTILTVLMHICQKRVLPFYRSNIFDNGDGLTEAELDWLGMRHGVDSRWPEANGSISVAPGRSTIPLTVSTAKGKVYSFRNTLSGLNGIYIPADRPHLAAASVDSVPLATFWPSNAYADYVGDVAIDHGTPWDQLIRRDGEYLTKSIKQHLMQILLGSNGGSFQLDSERLATLFDRFNSISRALLPDYLGFKTFYVSAGEIYAETKHGSILFDSLSSGVLTVLDICWRLFLADETFKGRYVVLFDEPEAHLHPSLQRDIIPAILSCFPRMQLIIGTHSTFVVTASRDSRVYALRTSDDTESWIGSQSIHSELLDYINKAAASNEVLREVLGIESSIPRWAEERLNAISRSLAGKTLNRESLIQFRKDMIESGLSDYLAEALSKAISTNDQTEENS